MDVIGQTLLFFDTLYVSISFCTRCESFFLNQLSLPETHPGLQPKSSVSEILVINTSLLISFVTNFLVVFILSY